MKKLGSLTKIRDDATMDPNRDGTLTYVSIINVYSLIFLLIITYRNYNHTCILIIHIYAKIYFGQNDWDMPTNVNFETRLLLQELLYRDYVCMSVCNICEIQIGLFHTDACISAASSPFR